MTPDWNTDLVWREAGTDPDHPRDTDGFFQRVPTGRHIQVGILCWLRYRYRRYEVMFSWIVEDDDAGLPLAKFKSLDDAKDFVVGYLAAWWMGLTPAQRTEAVNNMKEGWKDYP